MNASSGQRFNARISKIKYDVLDSDKNKSFVRFYERGMDFTESFFHKRPAFKHEEEVRVLIKPENAQYAFNRMLNKYRRRLREECTNQDAITPDLLAKVINDVHVDVRKENEENGIDTKNIPLRINDLAQYIRNVRVHPFAEDWYVKLINEICVKYGIRFGGKSDLYGSV